MLGVNQPPQHVRVEVETGEIKEEDTFLKFGKLQIKNAAMLGQHGSGLLEKFLVIQHAVGESLGVLCNSLRVELSYFLREEARIAGGSGNRERGIRGINIDRRDVQLKTGRSMLQIK